MSRSSHDTKASRPRAGITSDERRIEHRRRRAQLREQLEQDPEQIQTQERLWEQGDVWNWD